ncbi:MAG: L,D-transpeptidase [Ignavibacteria bacterium]|nr:L,D-transpeptidase [Ignavibacteria bacterium]
MIKKTKNIILPLILAAILFIGFTQDKANKIPEIALPDEEELGKRHPIPLLFSPVKDTIYVLGDEYIEICLKTQTAKLVQRNGNSFEYKISSGNPFISQGIETTTGIFTVQSKSPKAISKQFNNAELFWWVGFNGNIGFHGLAGNGYYHHLGVRSSSHGCVRISREDGKDLYEKVRVGTPVMVYKSEPARIFAFADFDDYAKSPSAILLNDDASIRRFLSNRLDYLYQGKAHTKNKTRVFIDGATKLRQLKISEGDFAKVSIIQEVPIGDVPLYIAEKDKLRRNETLFVQKNKQKEESSENSDKK